MHDDAAERAERRLLQLAIVWIVAARVVMMAAYPLMDTTEARYGELARVTAEGGFWLMPHMTPEQPFLAKPALSTWLAAGAYTLLGRHEFMLRLPSLLLTLATAWLLWSAARDFAIGRAGRWFMAATLATAPIFVVSAGAVMTDATHVAVVAAAMVVSWRALREPGRRTWRLCFWILLGIATLAKGLATLALIGLPLAAYALTGEGVATLWRRLWDPVGAVCAVAICAAWYVPAERAYPGFVYYLIVGEHFQRFLQSGWTGDRYGNAHGQPLGTIWIFWAGGIGTWTAVFLAQVAGVMRTGVRSLTMSDRWLWCWILAPIIFFTGARNIIMTYVLTAVPPFALAVGRWVETHPGRLRRIIPPFAVGIALVTTIVGATWLPEYLDRRSGRTLVTAALAMTPPRDLFIYDAYPFSASFYSRGTVRRIDEGATMSEALSRPGALLIVSTEVAAVMQNQPFRELARNPRAVLLEVVERR